MRGLISFLREARGTLLLACVESSSKLVFHRVPHQLLIIAHCTDQSSSHFSSNLKQPCTYHIFSSTTVHFVYIHFTVLSADLVLLRLSCSFYAADPVERTSLCTPIALNTNPLNSPLRPLPSAIPTSFLITFQPQCYHEAKICAANLLRDDNTTI